MSDPNDEFIKQLIRIYISNDFRFQGNAGNEDLKNLIKALGFYDDQKTTPGKATFYRGKIVSYIKRFLGNLRRGVIVDARFGHQYNHVLLLGAEYINNNYHDLMMTLIHGSKDRRILQVDGQEYIVPSYFFNINGELLPDDELIMMIFATLIVHLRALNDKKTHHININLISIKDLRLSNIRDAYQTIYNNREKARASVMTQVGGNKNPNIRPMTGQTDPAPSDPNITNEQQIIELLEQEQETPSLTDVIEGLTETPDPNLDPNIVAKVADIEEQEIIRQIRIVQEPENIVDQAIEITMDNITIDDIREVDVELPIEDLLRVYDPWNVYLNQVEQTESIRVLDLQSGTGGPGFDFSFITGRRPDNPRINPEDNPFRRLDARDNEIIKVEVEGIIQRLPDSVYVAFVNFARQLMYFYRGQYNVIPQAANHLLILSTQSIGNFIRDNYLTILEIYRAATPPGTSLYFSYLILRYIYYTILELCGYLTPITDPIIKGFKYFAYYNSLGQIISTEFDSTILFTPQPISYQNKYNLIEGEPYVVSEVIPDEFPKPTYTIPDQFDAELYTYIGNKLLEYSSFTNEPTNIQPTYTIKGIEVVSNDLNNMLKEVVYTVGKPDKNLLNKFFSSYGEFLTNNKQVITNFVLQPYPGDPDDDPEDEGDDTGKNNGFIPDGKKPKKFIETPQGQWYIVKTIMYWFLKPLKHLFSLTSEYFQYVTAMTYNIALSWVKTLYGNYPILFPSTIALGVLFPTFTLDMINISIEIVNNILQITKSIFSFITTPYGMIALGIGAAALIYAMTKGNNKFSLFSLT